MGASMWFEFFGGFFDVRIHDIWECDNKDGDLNLEHPFPRVLGYWWGIDNKKGDIMDVRVY